MTWRTTVCSNLWHIRTYHFFWQPWHTFPASCHRKSPCRQLKRENELLKTIWHHVYIDYVFFNKANRQLKKSPFQSYVVNKMKITNVHFSCPSRNAQNEYIYLFHFCSSHRFPDTSGSGMMTTDIYLHDSNDRTNSLALCPHNQLAFLWLL